MTLTLPSSRLTMAARPSDQLCLLAARVTRSKTTREAGDPEDAAELLLLAEEMDPVLTTTKARTARTATPPMTEPTITPRLEVEEGGELEGGGVGF